MLQRRFPTTTLASLLLGLGLIAALCASPPSRADERPGIPKAVRAALLHGRYEEALTKIAELAVELPDDADTWVFLRGHTQALASQTDAALATLQQLEQDFPESAWKHKARFRRAELLRGARRYQEAEAIYEAEAQRLRSEDRQGELADIYIRFGDQYSVPDSTPTPEEQRLDYGRALGLYARVLELEAPDHQREYATFRIAVCLQSASRWGEAVQAFERFSTEFDRARGGKGAPSRTFEARYRTGVCKRSAGDPVGARRTFEDLIAEIADAVARRGAWERTELDVATQSKLAQLDGDARFAVCETFADQGGAQTTLALAAYERFLKDFPAHERTTRAAIRIPRTYQALGRLEESLAAYDAFLARPLPASSSEAVREEHAELMMAALFEKGGVLVAGKRFAEAAAVFAEYTRRYPTGPHWSNAQQGIVDAEYLEAATHRSEERFDEAREAWTKFLEAHPLDRRARQIQFELGELFVEEAKSATRKTGQVDTGEESDMRALYLAAIAQWQRVVQKYAGSDEASLALFRMGVLHETELGELEAALEAYRACSFGAWSPRAQARLQVMTRPALEVATERSWRSNEAAGIELRVRNVEKVRVLIYKLDLEAYFRKHLTNRDIEDLDLDLIAPDESFDFEIEGYADYLPIERDVQIPVEGPGVWAVAVTDDERRATTLVVRSDVDILVKSSRREVFVYAQDMRVEAPAQGVSVLVAVPGAGPEGAPELHEILTDEDGIARLSQDSLKSADSVRVFAERGGHVAAEGLELAGLIRSSGLSPRGYVYTDRPGYRPGQEVRWRAILREVEDGAYSFEPGSKVRIEAVDSQSRVFVRRDLELSEFGTVAGAVRLAAEAPEGTYMVRVSQAGGPAHTGTFEVRDFRLQKVELTFDLERDVYYRGETVEVDVTAAYYYGEPIADSPLRYRLPDGRIGETRTDTHGRAHIEFGTREFPYEGELSFEATLTEEQVSRAGSVWLATTGYRAGLSGPGRVVVSGEPFAVTLHTSAPSGEDVSRALTLTVAKRESRPGGRWVELPVKSFELRTDEEDGTVNQTLALDAGGTYVMRAEGKDRFDNTVVTQLSQFVSADDDAVRLRLLVDDNQLQVGGKGEARILNRTSGGLALVTFEGEEVLEYRILKLVDGENPLVFDVANHHFPNFDVDVSMMRPGELLDARASFHVARKLLVTVTAETPTVAPNEEATIRVRATDVLGNPVRAELSLAVVDDALYEAFADAAQPVVEFFQAGAERAAAMRTMSSCTFAYRGRTDAVDEAVLQEQTRAFARARWEAARDSTVEELEALGYAADRAGATFFQDFDVQLAAQPQAAETLGIAAGLERGAGLDDSRKRFKSRGKASGPSTPGPAGPRRAANAPSDSAYDQGIATESGWDAVTAYWNASVVTDENGEASTTFRAPSKSSRWRVTARGTTAETLAGEAQGSLVTRADFFLELRTPRVLVAGDTPRFAVRVHNLTGLEGEAEIKLRVLVNGVRRVFPGKVTLGEETVVEHLFEGLTFDQAGELSLEVTASAELGVRPLVATTGQELVVRPWGVEYAASESGVVKSVRKLSLELPKGRDYENERVELFVGPSVDRLLVDLALGASGNTRQHHAGRRTYAGTASELLAACAVLDAHGASGLTKDPDHARLRDVCEARAAALVAGQRSDGGWSWTGVKRTSRPESASHVMIALARAQALGIVVPPATIERGANYLQQSFQRASQQADEEKAMILYALSALGRGDFGAANRLHRARTKLSPAALAYTTLALIEMERDAMAAEVAQTLEGRAKGQIRRALIERCFFPTSSNIGWNRSRIEMAALGLSALQRALPASPRTAELVEELLASRPWLPGRDRGMAVAALAEHQGRIALETSALRVRVQVGNGEVKTIALEPGASGESWTVPLESGHSGPVTVALELEGRGRPHFSAVLRGFGDPKQTGRQGLDYAFSNQAYVASAPLYDGRVIPTGFGVLRRTNETWTNEVKNLPLGKTTRMTLSYWRRGSNAGQREAPYLTLDVPLPAGARILDGSFRGALGIYEERAEGLRVPLGPMTGSGSISFTLVGAEPGEYRVLPPVLRDVHDPARMSVGKPMELTVLERGASSRDPYRATPEELFHMGKAMYAAGEFGPAHERLTKLYTDYESVLRDAALKEAANMLLFMSIDRREAPAIVRYFEVIKERDPELYVPFEKVVAIGEAYRELEEYERAMLIFRATVEETFGKDLKVAGALEEQGEFAGAVATLDRLWSEYPDFPTVIETRLTLSDKLLEKAPNAHADESLRRAGRDRASLTMEGVRLLQDFLGLYPTDPIAPDAGLNLVSAWLSLEDNEIASALAGDLALRFQEPRYADAFLYTRAVAEWYLGDETEAVKLLERIVQAEYPDARGVKKPSQNRDLALYILGQIHHARQEGARAAEYYERIKDLFPDAREALAGFREKAIELPEVTTARPGEDIALELTHKNVARAELLVYSVDLMTLYLREKNLSNVTEVNLAGIAPTLRTTVELSGPGEGAGGESTGGGTDLRPRKSKAGLALNEPGAYLVICRGDELHTSGLVLVSNLELEVKEDTASGHMRIQALDRENGRYVRDVDVRVIGSGNSEFISGETDPRGLFLADGIAGRSTVIARLDQDQYAFYRGAEVLGAQQQDHRGRVQIDSGGNLDQDAYLKNIYKMNEVQIQQRGQRLEKEIKRERKGVQVQQVK